MMKSLIPFILSTITVICFQNCGRGFDVAAAKSPANYVTDPIFHEYIEDFKKYHQANVDEVPIAFGDVGVYAGMCWRLWVGDAFIYGYIKVDKKNWYIMSEEQKTNLIFHELGHCALNRDHVSFESPRVCPTSFMYFQVMTVDCLQNHFEEYIKEMFP